WNKQVGKEIPYPGVAKTMANEKRIFHTYYQWVCLVLVLQAICFYIPRYFWKIFEGGRVKNLMLNLNQPIVKEGRQAGINLLATYLYENMTLNNTFFFVKYAFTELLN